MEFIVPGGDSNAKFKITGTTQFGGNVTSANISFGGENYSVNDLISVVGGNQQAKFTVVSVWESGGNITTVSADSGEYFSIGESFIVPGGKNDALVSVSDIDKTGYRFGNSCILESDWIYSSSPVKRINFGYNSTILNTVN